MPVEMIFNAPDVAALNAQIKAYVKALQPDPDKNLYTSPLVETDPVADMVARANETSDILADLRTEKSKKVQVKSKKSKKEDTPGVDLEPQPDPEPLPEPENLAEDLSAGVAETIEEIKTDLLDLVAAEKLKAEVISRMQEWFAAGKVKLIRTVLDQYGDGAKSFPEIPAQKFAEIDAAIKNGSLGGLH